MSDLKTNFNVSPYWDDFDPSKNFHRVLFKPGMAVQARELTQLQTILQNQVSRFGDHIFKEGSLVLGAGISLNQTAKTVNLNTSYVGSANTFDGIYIRGVTSNAVAKVIATSDLNETHPVSLHVNMLSGDEFDANEQVVDANTLVVLANTATANVMSSCFLASAPESVYFVRGHFVRSGSSSIVVDRDTANTSALIGFSVTENVVSSATDSTLLDPAAGSYNFSAPGADRLNIGLQLTTIGINDPTTNFIQLAKVVGGTVVQQVRIPVYSVLDDTLARRTFDESGSYTVRPFPIHYNENTANTSLLTVAVGAGKAFVQGRELETIATSFIDVPKPRTTAQINNASIWAQYGNYCYIDTVSGPFLTDQFETIDLHNVAVGSINTSSDGTYNATKIGTARIRQLIRETGSTYRAYLFDVQYSGASNFAEVESLFVGPRTNPLPGKANINTTLGKAGGVVGGDAILFDTNKNSLVFPLIASTVKTCRDSSNGVDTKVRFRKTFVAQTFASGSKTINLTDPNQSWAGGTGALSTAVRTANYFVVATTSSGTFTAGQVIDMSTGGRSITVSGSQITFNVNDATFNGQCEIIATIEDSVAEERTKSLVVNHNIAIATPNTTVGLSDSLGVSDVFKLKAVYMSSSLGTPATTSDTNVTSRYVLNNGQKDNVYDHGSIRLSGAAPTGQLLVVVDYFTHSGSGYFSVDSYSGSGVSYEEIPSFTSPTTGRTVQLRDVIDFRPRRADGSTALTANIIPEPDYAVNIDYQRYQGRVDALWIDSTGKLGITQGIPSVTPQKPVVDDTSRMVLYYLNLPAYVIKREDAKVEYVDNQRYTMRDIGDLAKRVERLEYYTALNSLERSANEFLVKDAAGLDRFKNGILVDRFADHSVGDVERSDYFCAIDPVGQYMTAPFAPSFTSLTYSSALSSGVVKTGDVITLPYTEQAFVTQTKATRSVNVNPFDVISWTGAMTLNPPSDQWVDTTQKPDVLVNIDGSNNSWEFGAGWGMVAGNWSSTTSLGTRVVDVSIVPFIRSRDVVVDVGGMKPRTRVWPFFDGVDVSSFCTPAGGSLGGPIVTNDSGNVSLTFSIPNTDPNRFRTGDRLFRLIDNTTNNINTSTTSASATYTASGILQTTENVNVSVRQFIVSQSIDTSAGGDGDGGGNGEDPTAQTFFVGSAQYPRGVFISSIDLYFRTKSTSIPVKVQIRPTVNGYPHSTTVFPFADLVKSAADVNVSEDGSVATRFTFDSPVYLAPGEYAVVILADTTDYELFVAEMGGRDLISNEIISAQPYVGSLFQSQNSSTWSADQTLDLKMVINKCVFDTSGSHVVTLVNQQPVANVSYDLINTSVQSLAVPDTNISMQFRGYPEGGPMSSDWVDFSNQTDLYLDNRHSLLSTTPNTLLVRSVMQSSNTDVSPVIDTARAGSILIENLINNDLTGEDQPVGGAAEARYITQVVTLNDGFDATDLRVLLDAYYPAEGSIDVYYKVLAGADSDTFDSKSWVKMFEVNKGQAVSDTRDQKFEVEYKSSDATIPAITYTSGSTVFDSFKQFAIKIVLTSTNPAKSPQVSQLRVMALA